MPIAEAFEERRRGGLPGARGGGRRRAARAAPTAARSRSAAAASSPSGSRAALGRHIVVWLEVDAEEAWRRIAHSNRPLANSRPRTSAACSTCACRSTRSSPTPSSRPRDRGDRRPRPALDPGAGASSRGDAGCSGPRAAPASTRSSSGSGLLDAGWWPLDGRRFCVSDTNVGGRSTRIASTPLAARIEVEPGEGAKTMARGRAGPARAGPRRDDPRGPRRRPRRRRRRRPGRLLRPHLPARRARRPGADLAGRPGRLRLRRQDRRRPARGQELRRRLPPARGGAQPTPPTLATLPAAELAAGFVEVAQDRPARRRRALGAGPRDSRRLDPARLDEIVFACARYKCAVVAADERDGGLRHVLNLGHTVGHAIEAASGYSRYRHGEAVGIGLLAALRLSEAPELADEVEAILAPPRACPSRLDPSIEVDAVLEALQRDKKRTAEGVGFVLLSAPGEPRAGQVARSG